MYVVVVVLVVNMLTESSPLIVCRTCLSVIGHFSLLLLIPAMVRLNTSLQHPL